MELSEEEKERTKRQKLIQGWDQEALKRSTVFIAGIGALGCEIAKDLALMGVGKLMLCDLDKIETSNLSRQMLFYKGDEGRYKAEVAAERLKLMNPYLITEVFTIPLQKIPMDTYMECDVVIAALDNVQARTDLNKFCVRLGIPMVEGGTVGFEGHVHVILPEASKNINGDPIPFGSEYSIVQSIADEMMWGINKEDPAYKGYFNAKKDIEELEEKIDAIHATRIKPVEEEIYEKAKLDFEEKKSYYLNNTPCYRCAVPVPPPAQKQVAACTLKGIPRTREHCAIRGEVLYIKKHEHKPDYDSKEDMKEIYGYTTIELEGLRDRVFEESISPEQKEIITPQEKETLKSNILKTFPNYGLEDIENVLGNKIPAVQSVSSIISSIQSQEALKLLFLKQGISVGPIMNPPYINYNGLYGLFDPVQILRNTECVVCGNKKDQENATIAISRDSKVEDIFLALSAIKTPITMKGWMVTNPVTKEFIYNPMFEKGRTGDKHISEFGITNHQELTFTPFGKAKEGQEITQYNIIVEFPPEIKTVPFSFEKN